MDGPGADKQSWLERIAARDRQRAEFVGTVSHDLKTPLNAIVGFTSVLLADRAGLQPEQVRQLRMVHGSARNLLARINGLLEFHRLEAGKIQARPEWVHPLELLLEGIEAQRAEAQERAIELVLDRAGGPIRIRTDAGLLRRIVGELLGNAIRFGAPGEVRLGLAVGPGATAETRLVRIEVSDSGQALTGEFAEGLRRVLAWQADPLERSYQGLGLGLALAREAAHLLGGRIELETEAEGLTRFSLVLELGAGDFEGA